MDRIQASTHYIRVLADQADRLGYDSAKKLVEAGIAPSIRDEKHSTIDNDLLAGFIRILWETTGDEAVGFQPTPVRLGTFGFIFENFMAAETLGEMLRKAHRCLRYVDYQNNALRLREARGQAILEVGVDTGERDPEYFWREFWAIIWHRVPCWAIGEKIPLIKAEFSYPAPAHWQLYEQQFQCRVAFGCPASTLVFNDKYLRRRICRDRQDVLAWLRHSPADLLYTPAEDHTLSSQIRGLVMARTDNGADLDLPTVDVLSHELHLTPQTLRRRLVEEGTSYQQLKNDLRCRAVMTQLENPDIPIGEIAYRVGFAEPTVLTRAFRKWTGMTPESYRQRHCSKPA